MKKTTPLTIILVALITSLTCQTVTNFSESSQPNTSEPVATVVLPTEIINPTPPAEGWIAFLNKNNIWLIHPDGSDLKQVTSNPISDNNNIKMKWSLDGQNLAFTQGGHLYVLDISTFAATLLIENTGGGFDWSPTSEEIIYSTPSTTSDLWSDNGLWAINLEDGEKRQIVAPSSSNHGFWDPEWSPEGSHVIFTNPGWEPAGYSVVDLAIGKSTDLPLNIMGGIGMGGCEWAPSDVIIACATITDEFPYKPELRLLNADGTVKQKILLPDEISAVNILWSPDGKELAMGYYNKTKASTTIFSLNTEDVQPPASGIPSDWSPDGRWLLTWLSENHVSPEIFVVNAISGKSFQISEGLSAIWQPLGDTVVSPTTPIITPFTTLATTNTPPSANLLCTDIYITVNHTPKGDFLQICSDSSQYEIGPLEKGAYAIGPNKKFFVYCTNGGDVYAGRIGETYLDLIGDVKDFSIIVRGEAPQLEFEFYGDHPYTVKINELILKQNKILSIPRYITAPN